MPAYTGVGRSYTDTWRPAAVLLGSALDGPIGETRWFSSAEQALYAFGGVQTARFLPSPENTSVILDSAFTPDDPTLNSLQTLLYHYRASDDIPVAYTALASPNASGSPVTLAFEEIGYDPAVQIYPGGLFLTAASYAKGGTAGSVCLPLFSAFLEAGDTSAISLGICRVGDSWLPPAAPSLVLSVTTPGGPITANFICSAQGDGTSKDIYLSAGIIVKSDCFIVDPGNSLYGRKTYFYNDYASWDTFLSTIHEDGLAGVHPLTLSRRSYDPSVRVSMPSVVPDASTDVLQRLSYSAAGYAQPDLTTAAAWAAILETEDLPLDDAPILLLAGLTGKVLANDPDSAQRILQVLDDNRENDEENPDLTLILPWDFAISPSVTVSEDVASLQNLLAVLDPSLSDRLLIVWGACTQDGIPGTPAGEPRIVPAAYMALGALLRESAYSDSSSITGSLSRPNILTALETGFSSPIVDSPSASVRLVDPSALPGDNPIPLIFEPQVRTVLPNPSELEMLQSTGFLPLTCAIGNTWKLHGPPKSVSGTSLIHRLVQLMIRSRCQKALFPFLGRLNTAQTRADVSATLADIATSLSSGTDAISRQISYLRMDVLELPDSTHPTLITLDIQGTLGLFGLTGTIVFQIGMGSTTLRNAP